MAEISYVGRVWAFSEMIHYDIDPQSIICKNEEKNVQPISVVDDL